MIEIQIMWDELLKQIQNFELVWQVLVIFSSLLGAWSLSGLVKSYVMRNAPENWKIGIGGISRVLFPISSLIIMHVGSYLLANWQSVSLIDLSIKLLWAMAAIRLSVYVLRYIFAPGGWVRTMESVISKTIWVVLALHLIGIWQDILSLLESIGFTIGKTNINVLMVTQALLTVLITLFITLSISRMLENRLMRSERLKMNVRVVISKLIRTTLSLVAILMALSAVGFDITLLSVFGGALGVGLGFGLQKIASNYVSGFIILLDDSLHIGDVVTVDTHYGVVTELRFRYMVIRKLDATEVIIPHDTVMTTAVTNHSNAEHKTRVLMPMIVSYDTDMKLAINVVKNIADKHPRILNEPVPEVLMKGFAESGIDLQLVIWVADLEEGTAKLQSEIYLEIWEQFKQNQIQVPFHQREISILNAEDKSASPGSKGNEIKKMPPKQWDDVH